MFSLVNEGLNPREELIGLHVLPGTCAHTLASLIQDVLIYVNAAVGNTEFSVMMAPIKYLKQNLGWQFKS